VGTILRSSAQLGWIPLAQQRSRATAARVRRPAPPAGRADRLPGPGRRAGDGDGHLRRRGPTPTAAAVARVLALSGDVGSRTLTGQREPGPTWWQGRVRRFPRPCFAFVVSPSRRRVSASSEY